MIRLELNQEALDKPEWAYWWLIQWSIRLLWFALFIALFRGGDKIARGGDIVSNKVNFSIGNYNLW